MSPFGTLTGTSSETRSRARTDPGAVLALPLVGAGLFASQYLTLPRVKQFVLDATANDSMRSIQTQASSLVLQSWRELLRPSDLVIALAVGLGLAYLLYAEISRTALSSLLARLETNRRLAFSSLALLSVVVTRYYLSPGDVFMGDSEAHTIRSWFVMENLRQARLPVWSNYWYGGYPLMEYYGPLYFTATALLSFVLGNVQLGTKALLLLTHLGSVFSMFLYLREVTGKRLAALVGATAFLLSFHRVHILLYRGDLQVAIVYLLYPAILLSVERFLRARKHPTRSFLVLTGLLAALILNHHGYAFFGIIFLGVYLLVRVGLATGEWGEKLRWLLFFAFAAGSATALAVFSLVPFMAGGGLVRGMREAPFSILIPSPRAPLVLLEMFRWSPLGGDDNIGYIGLSIAAFALVGLSGAVRDRRAPALALAACALTSLFMMRNFVDYNVKNTNYVMLFLAALSAWALPSLERIAPRLSALRRLRERRGANFHATLALVLLAILFLDLGPTTFHSVFRENYDFKERMYERIRALDGNHRVVERVVRKYVPGEDGERYYDPGSLGVVNAHSAIFTPLGRFHEGAGMSFGFDNEMIKALQQDLHRDRVSETALIAMYLLDVKYVLFRDRYRYYTPRLEPSTRFRLHDGLLELEHASPLLVSKKVVSLRDAEGYDPANIIETRRYFDPETYSTDVGPFREIVEPLIASMNVDLERGVAERLIAHGDELRAEVTEPGELALDVLEFHAGIREVTLRYRTNLPCFGRLAYSHFPYLRLEIDGEPVEFHRSATHHLLLSLPAGEHVITLRGGASPVRRWTAWFSLAALAGVIGGSRPLVRLLGRAGRRGSHF